MENERWLPIPNYEGRYEVSDMGNVRSLIGKSKLLKPGETQRGYLYVNLFVNDKAKFYTVHSLVMLAFVGERPDKMVIHHINDNPLDNRLVNLAYVTNQYNTQVGKRAALTPEDILEIRELLKTGLTQTAIGKRFGVTQRAIGYIQHGQRWANITPESAS